MAELKAATPRISVRLYKSIARSTVDSHTPVSVRYQGARRYIDLTPFLGLGSAVNVFKSVREPAGAFSITFADRPHQSVMFVGPEIPSTALESVYGLIEPMDMIEIRIWNGVGPAPSEYPIKMRGFVSDVQRMRTMDDNGKPQRQVVVSGQDYGKIWQMYQVLHLPSYAEGVPLLTSYAMAELFGIGAVNAMTAAEFVRRGVNDIINPHLRGFVPGPMPTEIQTGNSISVQHGKVNLSYQNMQGSVYDILKFHGDVGVWNELYVEDREDGVHAVYRPIPALHLTGNEDGSPRKIMDDAPDPVDVLIYDEDIQSISQARSDASVANFYWVNNSKFDLVDDQSRRLFALQSSNNTVSTYDYPNTRKEYYGTRPMYAETQQGDDAIENMGSGQSASEIEKNGPLMESWIDRRRRQMVELNRDNVVFERGSVRIKGGPMRPGGTECMKAGDYAIFCEGRIKYRAYVVSIADQFLPYQSYTTTLTYERGTNFAVRATMEGGVTSPWLAEMARR